MRYYGGMHDDMMRGGMPEVIREAVNGALRGIGDGENVDFVVECPDSGEHGDYASNVAMVLGKMVGRNPREVADDLCGRLDGEIARVDRIEVAGPGFLNFYLSRDFFYEQVVGACDAGEKWGMADTFRGKEVLVEYTSPNLFKPLHVGNLVGNIAGESVARLFEMQGASVRRINYPSDIGLTVAKGVWGLQSTGGSADDINALGDAYRVGNEAYEDDMEAQQEIEDINQKLYAGSDSVLQDVWVRGKQTSLNHLSDLCCQLGTDFDTVIFESEVGDAGRGLVREHIADGIFEEDDGAVVFRGERYGLHTRVFVNSQGVADLRSKRSR